MTKTESAKKVSFSQLVDEDIPNEFEKLANKLGTYALEQKLNKPQKGKLLEFLIISANKKMDMQAFFKYQQ